MFITQQLIQIGFMIYRKHVLHMAHTKLHGALYNGPYAVSIFFLHCTAMTNLVSQ